MVVVTEGLMCAGRPVDFSFYKLNYIDVNTFMEKYGVLAARDSRVGKKPLKTDENKFISRSVWFNNNKLTSIINFDQIVQKILVHPHQLGWIDFSFNRITHIDESILKFKDLKIIYFHGNCIANLDEIEKLKPLIKLRSVTFHGNPISNHLGYRQFVIQTLPQIVNLDFTPILSKEKSNAKHPDLIKYERRKSK